MAKKLTVTQKMVIAHILSEVQDKMRYDEDYGEYVDGGDIIIVLDEDEYKALMDIDPYNI